MGFYQLYFHPIRSVVTPIVSRLAMKRNLLLKKYPTSAMALHGWAPFTDELYCDSWNFWEEVPSGNPQKHVIMLLRNLVPATCIMHLSNDRTKDIHEWFSQGSSHAHKKQREGQAQLVRFVTSKTP